METKVEDVDLVFDSEAMLDDDELNTEEQKFDESESTKYNEFLLESRSMDLSHIENSGCIGVGKDILNNTCIYVLPRLALDLSDTRHSDADLLMDLTRAFVKISSTISNELYSVVYGHTMISLFLQLNMLRKLYHILPRRYKKNLTSIYILHPTKRVYLFLKLSKFVGKSIYSKCKFLSSISQLQQFFVSPLSISFPLRYLAQEDESNKHLLRYRTITPSTLKEMYCSPLGDAKDSTLSDFPTKFISRCVSFLRANNGLHQEGIFRIAGDESVLQLAKLRIINNGVSIILLTGNKDVIDPPPGGTWRTGSRDTLMTDATSFNSVLSSQSFSLQSFDRESGLAKSNGKGRGVSDACSDLRSSISFTADINNDNFLSLNGMRKTDTTLNGALSADDIDIYSASSAWSIEAVHDIFSAEDHEERGRVGVGLAYIVVQQVELVAQMLKFYLRELPEPVITFSAYDQLLQCVARCHSNVGGISQAQCLVEMKCILKEMPEAHFETLTYLLQFLAEVAANASVNKMTIDNLSVVFAPTLLRSSTSHEENKSEDIATALKSISLCQSILRSLLMDVMESRISVSMGMRMSDKLTGRMTSRSRSSAENDDV